MSAHDLPGRIVRLKDLLDQAQLNASIQTEIYNILNDFAQRIYSLDQDRTRCIAEMRSHEAAIARLQKQYSEVLYHLKSSDN